MRPSSQAGQPSRSQVAVMFSLLLALATNLTALGCGGLGEAAFRSPSTPPSTPEPPATNVSVSVAPSSATVLLGNEQTFVATVKGSDDTVVTWSVDGVPGGNAALGTITAAGVCTAPADLPANTAPQATATSHADSTKTASAKVAVASDVQLTLSTNGAAVELGATRNFHPSVSSAGRPDTSVRWSLTGGAYGAPDTAPSPNSLQVGAISSDDTSQSGSANVSISNGANILSLHPSSVYAGAAAGFVLRVDGSGFSAASAGPGSALLIAGLARTTTCSSAGECTAPVSAADVAASGTVSVQVRNPNGAKSNTVSLVVAPPNIADEVISLTNSAPSATAKDIVVVEPTTAGISVPGNDVDLNLAALGIFSTTNNSCSLTGNPVPLQRPASGGTTADICLFSESGLDSSMTFSVSGPGDITVLSKQPQVRGKR
jgi:hypothetical protein